MLLRTAIGEALRDARQGQGRTLREVSTEASVSLGHLSEVERGQKEASSELLAAISDALGLPVALLMSDVADRLALADGTFIPDTIPANLLADTIVPREYPADRHLSDPWTEPLLSRVPALATSRA